MEKQLTLRGLIVAAAGSFLVSMSSVYIAIKMGALPWPTVFAAIFSMFILKFFRSSLHEINVAHTGVSAGGLVAGGLAFTIPAAWIAGESFEGYWKVVLAAALGGIFGVGMTMSVRKRYVVDQELPFPMGIAAAETLKAGDEGGKKATLLFSSMGISALFTYLRDGRGVIPYIYKGFGMYPMAVGIGFIIGGLYTMSWLAGGLTGLALSSCGDIAKRFGLGMIIGGGLAMMIKGMSKSKVKTGKLGKLDLIVAVVIFLITLLLGFGIIGAMLFSILGLLMVHMAGAVDGTTGIDPMEVFAIIVLMIMRIFLQLDIQTMVFIAAAIAVATGIAGDSLQDMKTGYILGSNPKAQLVSEAVGTAVGVFVASWVLIALHAKYGTAAFGPGKFFPVPQATAVSQFITGGFITKEFLLGIASAFVLQLFEIPALTFGIGVYLPFFITLPVALGGAIRILFDKLWRGKIEGGMAVASGLLGGEGITGVLIGLFLPARF